ncbi:MAG: hypothetical protein ACFFBD_14670 [Candidatus Hodarchaeota archaeon]
MMRAKEMNKMDWVYEHEDITNAGELDRTADEMLEVLQSIGALVDALPSQLPVRILVGIILATFAQKTLPLVLKNPSKMYHVIQQYVLEKEQKNFLRLWTSS